VNKEDPAIVNNLPVTVIKDEYRRPGRRFNEAEILHHIHAEEEIPGIVHIAHSETVMQVHNIPVCSGDRQKNRIGLSRYEKPFMDLKTPLAALMVIYDLLESESEFNVLDLLLILFGNSHPTLVLQMPRAAAAETYCMLRHISLPPLIPTKLRVNTRFVLSGIYWILHGMSSTIQPSKQKPTF
jgi:hypothetical protein